MYREFIKNDPVMKKVLNLQNGKYVVNTSDETLY